MNNEKPEHTPSVTALAHAVWVVTVTTMTSGAKGKTKVLLVSNNKNACDMAAYEHANRVGFPQGKESIFRYSITLVPYEDVTAPPFPDVTPTS